MSKYLYPILLSLLNFLCVYSQRMINVTSPPCNLDNTGITDVTTRLQDCIDYSSSYSPPLPLFFPLGDYLISNTIYLNTVTTNHDSHTNTCPSRYEGFSILGATSTSGNVRRPRIVLASGSFVDASNPKHMVDITCCGDSSSPGRNMNQVWRGIDLVVQRDNSGAVGFFNNGAQGASIQDSDVVFETEGFAGFGSVPGAGGFLANVKVVGGQFGILSNSSQPVPAINGVALINQTVSAIVHTGQQTLSLVGGLIQASETLISSSPGLVSSPLQGTMAISLSDVVIDCQRNQNSLGINSSVSLDLANVFFLNCEQAVDMADGTSVAGSIGANAVHVRKLIRGINPTSYQTMNVIYHSSNREANESIIDSDLVPVSTVPDWMNFVVKHSWNESTFVAIDDAATVNAILDCNCVGDGFSDDTASLQACVDSNARVYIPPGKYLLSSPLLLNPGNQLIGAGNVHSILIASSNFSISNGRFLVQTSSNDAESAPTVLAFLGLFSWWHIPELGTLLWQSNNPLSMWRLNYETRECECLWWTNFEARSSRPPCELSVSINTPKSMFTGKGKVFGFVNDGDVFFTGPKYRHLEVSNTTGPLSFYALNLEHAQSESNSEIKNSSNVVIYGLKGEGNLPIVWVRDSINVSIRGFGGGLEALPLNWTYPSGFELHTPSLFRISNSTSVTLSNLIDYGRTGNSTSWPPTSMLWPLMNHSKYLLLWPDPWESMNQTLWNPWNGYLVSWPFWSIVSVDDAYMVQPGDRPVLFEH
jgi:Pectate lyase superfamily protein